ncbi:MAG: T9SS type A sorting domain-containing protein [Jejuia sp.]
MPQLQGEFLSNNSIFLKDNLLNKVHNLSESDYAFTSGVGEFNERFQIVFKAYTLSQQEFELENTITIVQLDDEVMQFNSETSAFKTIEIFDVLGRPLYELKGNNSKETYNLSNLKTSVYIANIELSDGKRMSKKFIKN